MTDWTIDELICVCISRQVEDGEVLAQAIDRDSRHVDTAVYARRGFVTRARDWCAFFIVRLATVVLARGRDY